MVLPFVQLFFSLGEGALLLTFWSALVALLRATYWRSSCLLFFASHSHRQAPYIRDCSAQDFGLRNILSSDSTLTSIFFGVLVWSIWSIPISHFSGLIYFREGEAKGPSIWRIGWSLPAVIPETQPANWRIQVQMISEHGLDALDAEQTHSLIT